MAWASKNALSSTSGPVSTPSAFHVKRVVVATPFEGGTQTTPPLLVRSQLLMTSLPNGRALRGEIGSTEPLHRGTNHSWSMSNWRIGARGVHFQVNRDRTAQAGPGFSFVVRADARETALALAAGATRRAIKSRRQSSDGQARWLVALFHVKLVVRNLRSSSHRSPAVESLRESVRWRYSGAALMRAARTQPCCDGAVVRPMPSEGPSVSFSRDHTLTKASRDPTGWRTAANTPPSCTHYPQVARRERKRRTSELELIIGCAEGVPKTDGKPVRSTTERRGFT